MPDVRLPDGTIVKNVPDGTTKAELMRRLGRSFEPEDLITANPAEYDPTSPEFQARFGPVAGMSTLDKLRAGFGKTFVDLGHGVRQLYAQSPMGMLGSGQSTDPELNREVALSRERDAPLMQTGAGRVGAVAGGVAAAIPSLAVPGATSLPGAAITGALFGAAQPVVDDQERIVNTGIGAGLGLAGQAAGQKLAQFAAQRLGQRAAQSEATNVARQPMSELIGEARGRGLVIPPTTANPSVTNRVLEGLAGKLTTGQGASVLNQRTFNNLAKRAIGIPDDVPLSQQSVRTVRENAGKVYGQIAETGDVIADQKFLDDVLALPEEITSIAKDFPDLPLEGAAEVQKLAEGLFRDKFSARSAIEVVKRLRKDSSAHFKSFDDPAKRALAFAERRAADAVDDLLVRHLQGSGNGALAGQYDQARRLIAQTHTIESALNEAGNISAQNLARQVTRGKPLSGDLSLIGRFAQAFPKAARETTESFPGFSPLDYGFSGLVGGGAVAAGSTPAGLIAALPVLRAATRRGILSGPAQKALLNPSTTPALPGTAALNLLRALGIAGAPIGVGSVEAIEQEAF